MCNDEYTYSSGSSAGSSRRRVVQLSSDPVVQVSRVGGGSGSGGQLSRSSSAKDRTVYQTDSATGAAAKAATLPVSARLGGFAKSVSAVHAHHSNHEHAAKVVTRPTIAVAANDDNDDDDGGGLQAVASLRTLPSRRPARPPAVTRWDRRQTESADPHADVEGGDAAAGDGHPSVKLVCRATGSGRSGGNGRFPSTSAAHLTDEGASSGGRLEANRAGLQAAAVSFSSVVVARNLESSSNSDAHRPTYSQPPPPTTTSLRNLTGADGRASRKSIGDGSNSSRKSIGDGSRSSSKKPIDDEVKKIIRTSLGRVTSSSANNNSGGGGRLKRAIITGPDEREEDCDSIAARRVHIDSNFRVDTNDGKARGERSPQVSGRESVERWEPPADNLGNFGKDTSSTERKPRKSGGGSDGVVSVFNSSESVRLEKCMHGLDTGTPLTNGLVDTHMHIDFTLQALRAPAGTSWKDLYQRFSERFPTCYEGAIAAFCQPDSLRCSSLLLEEAFRSEKLWMTFGVHPHFADQYSEDSLRACLHKFKSKVVALGEIGLDTSMKNHVSLEVQKEVFRSQAEIGIECGLPLVVHSRVRQGNGEALAFMRQFVPRDYRIHRHCFAGDWEEANEWMSQFRNCYVGFTPLINMQRDLMEVAARIPLDRILLETDAPYFKTGLPALEGTGGNGRPQASVPGDVIYTAVGIAKAKRLPLEAVICQTRLNAKTFYNI